MGGVVAAGGSGEQERADAELARQQDTEPSHELPAATVRRTKSRVRRDLLQHPDAAAASRSTRPMWIELHLELSDENYDWFEGSISPWKQVDRPEVEWEPEARELLKIADLTAPDREQRPTGFETRVLSLLPHLYSLGVNRVLQELQLDEKEAAKVELFPLVGFAPHEDEKISFETLRMNVAVIDEVIVTIRLPNLVCPPSAEPRALRTAGPLNVPPRFLPAWDASALDVAEEVARHQAATTRALADEVRRDLQRVLEDAAAMSSHTDALTGDARLALEQGILSQFAQLSRIAEMADRQLARLLRRMGSYGEETEKLEPADIRRRYGYALDEVRTLGREIVSARDRHLARADTERQAEREQFQFIAALVGSSILIPTLIAGIFGANVWVPGEAHAEGFVALIAFILAFATGGTWLIDRSWKRRWRPPPGLRPTFGVIALIALVAGISMLVVDAVRTERHTADRAAESAR